MINLIYFKENYKYADKFEDFYTFERRSADEVLEAENNYE